MLHQLRHLLLITATLATSPAQAETPFAPGHWHHETRLVSAEVPGIPQWLIRLFASHSTRESCASTAQLASHPESLLTADDRAHCTLRHLSTTNGQIDFSTYCTNHHFPEGLLVSSHGTWTPTHYQITTTSTGTRNGKPVRIETTGTGRLVGGACTGA